MLSRFQAKTIYLLLIAFTPVGLLISVCVGPVAISFAQFLSVIPHVAQFSPPDDISMAGIYSIVTDIRLPRTAMAWLVGASLAMSGAAMQGLFRNPLADPSIIGVTSGASLGASIAIVLVGDSLLPLAGLSTLVIGAFIGGILAAFLVYRLATGSAETSTNGTSVATMLLVGIAITALAGAGNSLLAYFSDNDMLRRISLWNMGGLDVANGLRVKVAVLIIAPTLLALMYFRRSLDAPLLGEPEARYLGVDVQRVKVYLVLLVSIGVAASVALAGVIGFVGLVVPHILRLLMGPSHNYLLPCAAMGGGLLLVLADSLARVVVSPAEMPVGVITALLGAPLFISLLRHRREYGML